MSTAELACSYAALILADDGVEVTVRTWPLLSILDLCAMDGGIIHGINGRKSFVEEKEHEKFESGMLSRGKKDARFN